MNLPSAPSEGCKAATEAPPSKARLVEGVQPAAPAHVSRTKTWALIKTPIEGSVAPPTTKATKRPPEVIVASKPASPLSSLFTETLLVEGVQLPSAPKHVSRTKMPMSGTLDWKTTKRPSALSFGAKLKLLTGVPLLVTEPVAVVGVRLGSAPKQVSRPKIC